MKAGSAAVEIALICTWKNGSMVEEYRLHEAYADECHQEKYVMPLHTET